MVQINMPAARGNLGPVVAHCVIGGAPPNFRSRRTSCRSEVDSDTDEDDPMRSFPPALAKLQN